MSVGCVVSVRNVVSYRHAQHELDQEIAAHVAVVTAEFQTATLPYT